MQVKTTLAILFTLLCIGLSGLQINGGNRLRISNLDLSLELVAEQRIGDFSYSPLNFSSQSVEYADSVMVIYSSQEMDLRLSFSPASNMGENAWQVIAAASFKQNIYLRQLYLNLKFDDSNKVTWFKGIEAIEEQDTDFNRNPLPFTDKVVQYSSPYGSFWIIASNYKGCSGVERLGNKTIRLYDNGLHFYRRFRESTQAADLPRDTMFKTAGSKHEWGFLLFESRPFLLEISRWPTGKQAALCITNDADSESQNRLSAIYLGSTNPDSPKYLTTGLIAHGINVSNTVFGVNQSSLQNIWQTIKDAGNSIGYHTYSATTDAPGTNAQALLNDLAPFNIRLWVDHNVPQNPEDLAWNGLDPGSVNFVADVINQSNIDYAWFNDTPPTNPFNAFEDPWRLPHLIYEATALTRPVWFFGRTRAEVWEFTNGNFGIDMKSTMTAQNIEKLLVDRGLHISYTHFSANWTTSLPYFVITPEGYYEIRDEVEEMLQMLAYYRDHRGLWIATVESIFDRMLAIEKVEVTSYAATAQANEYLLTLKNNSAVDINDFSFVFQGVEQSLDHFPAGSSVQMLVHREPDQAYQIPPAQFSASYENNTLKLENKSSSMSRQDEVRIYNLRGQLVKNYFPAAYTKIARIPFQEAASGVYFLQVKHQGQTAWTGKVIVLK
jgi:hypothetical protein